MKIWNHWDALEALNKHLASEGKQPIEPLFYRQATEEGLKTFKFDNGGFEYTVYENGNIAKTESKKSGL